MKKETVSIISILSNSILGFLKIVLGLASKSSALIAEGIHTGIDIILSVVTLLGITIAKRKPTELHPYGWARAEVLAGFLITLFWLGSSLGILWDAARELLKGEFGVEVRLPALLVMVISTIVYGILAQAKIQIGQKEESLALIAEGKHTRVDVLLSGGVLLGLGASKFFPIADSLAALMVGLYSLFEALILSREITENLLDVADPEVEEQIRKVCKEEQVSLAILKTRKIGSLTFAELEVTLPADVKISRADSLISELQNTLIKKIPRLEYVVVQIKGMGKRLRMLRGKCAETLERIEPEKQGFRVIEPYKDGKPYEDFGAPEYLVIDFKNEKEVLRKIVKNPYYKIGRGHGIRFAKAVQADKVKTVNIGPNARENLKDLGIEVASKIK